MALFVDGGARPALGEVFLPDDFATTDRVAHEPASAPLILLEGQVLQRRTGPEDCCTTTVIVTYDQLRAP